ncbi:hypothetical protein GBAR_LOCUS1080 [Geodia barretti]|uniref:Uncharacterized protein n=1 Tax=Geodia barretti TaxID=519541 RepID=A0AA35QVA2_GEOBA|nr:hypothetical protein GBAR_LOCUS1080 [Geodia barretti]
MEREEEDTGKWWLLSLTSCLLLRPGDMPRETVRWEDESEMTAVHGEEERRQQQILWMSSVLLVMPCPVADGYQIHRRLTVNADSRR